MRGNDEAGSQPLGNCRIIAMYRRADTGQGYRQTDRNIEQGLAASTIKVIDGGQRSANQFIAKLAPIAPHDANRFGKNGIENDLA